MSTHNPRGIEAPIEEWTHDDLVAYMTWQVIAGLTKGEPIRAVVFHFPQVVNSWAKARDLQVAMDSRRVSKMLTQRDAACVKALTFLTSRGIADGPTMDAAREALAMFPKKAKP